jgi:uroporphyrinogen decarboxylase
MVQARRNIQQVLAFRKPDWLPCAENFWEDTLIAWRGQGMPAGLSPQDCFDLDIDYMSIDASPRFDQQVVSREGDWYTYTDRWGYSAKKKYGKSSSVHFFNHVTTDRDAWKRNRHRWSLDVGMDDEARIDKKSYFEHFDRYPTWRDVAHIYRDVCATGRYLLYNVYGPWEATWRHRGYENALMDLIEDPEWIREMAETHVDLTISVLKRCIELDLRPDGLFMVDDLADNRGPLFSPGIWRDHFKPSVKRLGDYLKSEGIDFWTHCCGNPVSYFPDFIECGVRVVQPLQVSAGLHVARLRKEFGRELVLFGNISAHNMSGEPAAIEKEIAEKVGIASEGGYIFHSDHSIPPTISFERYQWVLSTARRLFGAS